VTATAGASVFSGRPDPTWPLLEETLERLRALWESLEPTQEPLPMAPVLGYRGCFVVEEEGREWRAFEGTVTLTAAGRRLSRLDGAREFERVVLESAPGGALPPELIGGW